MTHNLNTCFNRNKSIFNEYSKSLSIVQLPVGKTHLCNNSSASKCRVNYYIRLSAIALLCCHKFIQSKIPFREIRWQQFNEPLANRKSCELTDSYRIYFCLLL